MKGPKTNFISRNVHLLWLLVLFVPPSLAFAVYRLTPHEEAWHQVLYSLLCVPLFVLWLLAVLGCVVSFLLHRMLTRA